MKKTLSILLLFALLLSFVSCGVIDESSTSSADDMSAAVSEIGTDESGNGSDFVINTVTEAQQTLLRELAEEWGSSKVTNDSSFRMRQYDFALKLYRAFCITSENENVMLSPLSIQLALAMATNGAVGKTKAEMEYFLGGISMEQLNGELRNFVSSLPSSDDYKLGIANSIWMRDQNLDVKESFLNINTDYYNADLYTESFDDDTVKKINGWVNEKTYGMINGIVDHIDPLILMYLINAVAFDAKWDIPYEGLFSNADFTTAKGEKKTVEMMVFDEYEYIITDDAVGFVKPYRDNKYSFVGLLPNEDIAISDYIASLSAEKLTATLDNVKTGLADIRFPKFSYEYSLELSPLLSAMGMPTAFESTADFSEMATSPLGNIYLDSVLHKTFISVDNEGTRAAAVTSIPAGVESVPMYQLRASFDRPFVYMIIENETKLPIFIGTVMDIGE